MYTRRNILKSAAATGALCTIGAGRAGADTTGKKRGNSAHGPRSIKTVFETVADAVASSDIAVGDYIQTLGYHIPGDGGGNLYEIVPPRTGRADGGSCIDLPAIPGQAQAFMKGTITPLMFGARADGSNFAKADDATDDTKAITAAVEYWYSNYDIDTLDFMNRTYTVSGSIRPEPSPSWAGVHKTMKNGSFHARSSYAGDQIFDFSQVAFSKKSMFSNLTFRCGPGDRPSYAPGAFLFGEFAGMEIDGIYVDFFSGSALKATSTGAAGETIIHNCYISGSTHRTGDSDVVGIEWDRGDCEIYDNLIRTCTRNIHLRAGAITVRGNHLWCGDDASQELNYNIYQERCRNTVIVNNYIDNGIVYLGYDGKGAPRRSIVNDNKWVVKEAKAKAWAAADTGWIELDCKETGTEEDILRDFQICNNRFGGGTDADIVDVPLLTKKNRAWDNGEMRRCKVKDNTFTRNLRKRTTHPTLRVDFTSAASVDVNLSDYRVHPDYVHEYVTSVVMQASSGTGYVARVSRDDTVFTVHLSEAMSGSIILSATSNDNVDD